MSVAAIITGASAAAALMPLAFDAIALAKAIHNIFKAGDNVSETDLENLEIKRQRLIDNAMVNAQNWEDALTSLRAWINEQRLTNKPAGKG